MEIGMIFDDLKWFRVKGFFFTNIKLSDKKGLEEERGVGGRKKWRQRDRVLCNMKIR